jgi:hypothetical protein
LPANPVLPRSEQDGLPAILFDLSAFYIIGILGYILRGYLFLHPAATQWNIASGSIVLHKLITIFKETELIQKKHGQHE